MNYIQLLPSTKGVSKQFVAYNVPYTLSMHIPVGHSYVPISI
ncbi:hypothetical protein [uncultured Ilyobacter sp.]